MGADNTYYSDRSAWSNSNLKRLEEDELDFDAWYKGREDLLEQKFGGGQFAHVTLERMVKPTAETDMKFHFFDKLNWATKEGKIQKAELSSLEKTHYLIPNKEKALLRRVARLMWNNKELQALMNSAAYMKTEVEFRKVVSGILMKGALDLVLYDENDKVIAVVDWKTSGQYNDFVNKCYKMKYTRQAVLYSELAEIDPRDFYFAVMDVTGYSRAKLMRVQSESFIKHGQNLLTSGITKAKLYMELGVDGFNYGEL